MIIYSGSDPDNLAITEEMAGDTMENVNGAATAAENNEQETAVESGTSDINKRFGRSVRTMRRAMDITQFELADRAGLNRTYLVRIESGEMNITLNTAQKIADALQTDVITLLKGIEVTIL